MALHLANWINPALLFEISVFVGRFSQGDLSLAFDIVSNHDEINNVQSLVTISSVPVGDTPEEDARLKEELATLHKQVAGAQAECLKLKNEYKELDSRFSDVNTKYVAVLKTRDELDIKLKYREQKYQSVKKKYKTLTTSYEASKAQFADDIQAVKESKNAVIRELEEEKSVLENELEEAKENVKRYLYVQKTRTLGQFYYSVQRSKVYINPMEFYKKNILFVIETQNATTTWNFLRNKLGNKITMIDKELNEISSRKAMSFTTKIPEKLLEEEFKKLLD
jgi:hypothetical protein